VILAITAAQVAPAEKHGPTSPRTADTGFLPEVQGSPGQFAPAGALAESGLDVAIDPALPGA